MLWSTIIAVLGTLAAGVLAPLTQSRAARTQRREIATDQRRDRQIQAVTALAEALARHRRTMFTREDLRLRGLIDQPAYAAEREASHATRDALTAPLTAVAILAPALAEPAQRAEHAAYALRNAPDHAALDTLRESAVDAVNHLVTTAGQHLA